MTLSRVQNILMPTNTNFIVVLPTFYLYYQTFGLEIYKVLSSHNDFPAHMMPKISSRSTLQFSVCKMDVIEKREKHSSMESPSYLFSPSAFLCASR